MKLYMKRLTAIPFDTAGVRGGKRCKGNRPVVSECLHKVMNFRFIDHGDSKIGLSSPTKRIMWSPPFFEQDKQDLKREASRSSSSSFGRIRALLGFRASYGYNPVKLVTNWLMFFPEGKPRVLKLRPKTRGGSECVSQ